MIRKMTLALVAVTALAASALVPTAASAHGWHYGFGGFGRFGFGITIAGPGYDSCLHYRLIETRRGLRRVLVNHCGW